MMTRQHLFFVLVCCLLGFSGCQGDQSPPLRIGTSVWPGYEPLFLARELGYLDTKAVHLVEYPSASEVIRAFRNQAIDGAALTLDEVLLLAQDKFDLRVVLIMDISNGGDVIVGQADMQTIRDLVGRRVAVEGGALGAYVLSRALMLNRLAPSDIEVVQLEADEHARAFKKGVVDAAVTFEPVRSELLAEGASLLFDSTKIPGEIVDVLVVRKGYLDENPGTVRDLVLSWFRAVAYLDKHPQDAAVEMAKRHHISGVQFLRSLDGLRIPSVSENIEMLDGDTPTLAVTGQILMSVMLEQGLLGHAVDLDSLIEPMPMRNARL